MAPPKTTGGQSRPTVPGDLWADVRDKRGNVNKRKLTARAKKVFLNWARHPYWNDPPHPGQRGDAWSGPRAPKKFRVSRGNPYLVPAILIGFRSISSKRKTDALLLIQEERTRRCRRLSRLKDHEQFGAASQEVDHLVSQVRYVFCIGYNLAKTGEWLTDGVREEDVPRLLRSVDTPGIHYGLRPWQIGIEADAKDLGVTPEYLETVASSITLEHLTRARELAFREKVKWSEIPGRLGLPQVANLYLRASAEAIRSEVLADQRAQGGKTGARPVEPATRVPSQSEVINGRKVNATEVSLSKFWDMARFLRQTSDVSKRRALQLVNHPYPFLREYKRFSGNRRVGITFAKRFLKQARGSVLDV